jgi:site-specific DNA recombinase
MRDTHPEYLLTGLITCGDCGRNYVGVSASGRGHRYRYYACWGRQRYGKETCTGGRIRADVIEAVIFDAILALYADPTLIERAVATKTQEAVAAERQHRDEIVATRPS